MEEEGLKLLQKAKKATGLGIVTEVMSDRDVDLVANYADVLQIGARNMQNFALLKNLGKCGRPILLKRGLSATVKELLMSAEYIVAHGNQQVMLCERGIRTFETVTRNTCDIGAIAALNELTHLPVILDPSHAAAIAAVLGVLLGVWAYWFYSRPYDASRLVQCLPPDRSLHVYLNVGLLRSAGIMDLLAGSQTAEEADYKQFVQQTGFDYRTDLEAVAAGFRDGEEYFAIQGRFQWNRLADYVRSHQG